MSYRPHPPGPGADRGRRPTPRGRHSTAVILNFMPLALIPICLAAWHSSTTPGPGLEGPAVWVLLGEMFNNRIRAFALGLAAAAQWITNFLISQTFPTLADVGLGVAYGLYTAFAVLSLLFVARYVTETNGRQLEDM